MEGLHPQIVHFTIALVVMGVAFRLISLLGRPAFAGCKRQVPLQSLKSEEHSDLRRSGSNDGH
jgi:uncharacterized membrane protein